MYINAHHTGRHYQYDIVWPKPFRYFEFIRHVAITKLCNSRWCCNHWYPHCFRRNVWEPWNPWL